MTYWLVSHGSIQASKLCFILFFLLGLLGMLSKSLGQILRVAVSMHVLFSVEEEEICTTVSEKAIKAAINFVEVCCQQTAYLTGRGEIDEELQLLQAGD